MGSGVINISSHDCVAEMRIGLSNEVEDGGGGGNAAVERVGGDELWRDEEIGLEMKSEDLRVDFQYEREVGAFVEFCKRLLEESPVRNPSRRSSCRVH